MITELINKLEKLMNNNDELRKLEKEQFIKNRMQILNNNFQSKETNSDLADKYLQYSSSAVIKYLSYENPNNNLREIFEKQIFDYGFKYSLKTIQIDYNNPENNNIKCTYSEANPKIAIINVANTTHYSTFIDGEDLTLILNQFALSDCYKQFNQGLMKPEALVRNVINLSQNKDEAFIQIVKELDYNITNVSKALKLEYKFDNMLDKGLKHLNNDRKFVEAMLSELSKGGVLEKYVKERMGEYSILTPTAKAFLSQTYNEYSNNLQKQYSSER